MFARSEPRDEGVELRVGQGDVGAPECRNHLDLRRDEIGRAEYDDGGEAFESRFAKHLDFVIVGCGECGQPVASPVGKSTPEADGVSS